MAAWTGDCVENVTLPNGQVVSDVATLKGVECAVGNVLGVVLSLAAIVVFAIFLMGGFKYMTAGGDPKAVDSAKGTLTQAIVGLVILVLAYVLLLIIEAATGIPVTKFRVTTP